MNPPSTLADLTGPSLVRGRLKATDGTGAIRELAELLARAGAVRDASVVERLALERERLAPTDCDDGMALPHARLPGAQDLVFAVGRSEAGLPWGSKASPVRIIFLVVVPENQVGPYLQLISGLARLSRQRELLDSMFGAKDDATLLALLGQAPLRAAPAPARAPASRG